MALAKSKQDQLKDVGGFIGGKLFNGVRKAGYAEKRDLITLDLDNIPANGTNDVLSILSGSGVNYCVYSTRKHAPEAPRLRVIFPLSRSVTPDEYEPCARMMASIICRDMIWFDPTSFKIGQIMYWPSISSDSEYIYRYEDKPFVDADGLLALYADWRDFSSWSKCPSEDFSRIPGTKQADPTEKTGIVGAFCKVHPIREAMEKFLPGIYIPTGAADRYTYAKGSTTGGAIVYEDKFLFSHHATDPAGGILCNAFDLCRIHLFGNADELAKEGTPTHKLPSYQKMKEFAFKDNATDMKLRTERAEEVYNEFSGVSGETAAASVSTLENAVPAPTMESKTAWMKKLKVDGNGVIIKSCENALVALENDPLLKGRVYFNEFTKRPIGLEPLPWGTHKSALCNSFFEWKDADDSGLLIYLEKLIGIQQKSKVTDALTECRASHPYHPVKEYLQSLIWDEIPRIGTLFHDYLGAEDTPYTQALSKMFLVAAIKRIFSPGIKFDTIAVFVGPQGIGKSTFIRLLAKNDSWYTDDLKDLGKKESVENIQGVWLVELSELASLRKADLETAKAFISRTEDNTRLAYAHYAVTLPRTCVFFGTTNTHDFLKDSTGDRRFYPIDCGVERPTKRVFGDLEKEVDQIWAEAMAYYIANIVKLTLPDEIETQAAGIRKDFDAIMSDPYYGDIEDFLSKPVLPDWDRVTEEERSSFWVDTEKYCREKGLTTVPRADVCTYEIWRECFKHLDPLPHNESIRIANILRRLGYSEGPRKYSVCYKRQRYYIKDS